MTDLLPSQDGYPTHRGPRRTYGKDERDQWGTRNHVINLAHMALGGITLDAATSSANPCRATRFYTDTNSCLEAPSWGHQERVWLNPPFSKPHLFLAKLLEQINSGSVQASISLLKSGAMHNQKTGSLLLAMNPTICIWGAGKTSRMNFVDPDGYLIIGSNFDSILAYTGPHPDLFAQTFNPYGWIVNSATTGKAT